MERYILTRYRKRERHSRLLLRYSTQAILSNQISATLKHSIAQSFNTSGSLKLLTKKTKLVFKINFNALMFELVVLFGLLIFEQYSLLVYGVLAARLFILLSCFWHYKKSALLYKSNGAMPL